jgi:nucleoside-diphosphate-sugar epimerase
MDLRQLENTRIATSGIDEVYNLAADMGGMGFIENNKAECMLSSLINTHMLLSARENNVSKFFFASSACVYNDTKQKETINPPLTESDAYPAAPEDGYGWEKLFSERMCRHFFEDFGLAVRVARFHNIYGPNGTWSGGREKAPAAICRKVVTAVKTGVHEINIWGDGEQTRSFTFISDAVEGVNKLMKSDFTSPINIGSSELVSINQLVTIVEDIAGIKLKRTYDLKAPKGVRGRSSDNSLCKEVLDWEPKTTLIDGISETYKWIFDKVI